MAQQQVMGKGRRLELMTIFWARKVMSTPRLLGCFTLHTTDHILVPHLHGPGQSEVLPKRAGRVENA